MNVLNTNEHLKILKCKFYVLYILPPPTPIHIHTHTRKSHHLYLFIHQICMFLLLKADMGQLPGAFSLRSDTDQIITCTHSHTCTCILMHTHMCMRKSTLHLSAREAANSMLAPGPSVTWCEGPAPQGPAFQGSTAAPPSGHLGQREQGESQQGLHGDRLSRTSGRTDLTSALPANLSLPR